MIDYFKNVGFIAFLFEGVELIEKDSITITITSASVAGEIKFILQ